MHSQILISLPFPLIFYAAGMPHISAIVAQTASPTVHETCTQNRPTDRFMDKTKLEWPSMGDLTMMGTPATSTLHVSSKEQFCPV